MNKTILHVLKLRVKRLQLQEMFIDVIWFMVKAKDKNCVRKINIRDMVCWPVTTSYVHSRSNIWTLFLQKNTIVAISGIWIYCLKFNIPAIGPVTHLEFCM